MYSRSHEDVIMMTINTQETTPKLQGLFLIQLHMKNTKQTQVYTYMNKHQFN